MDLSFGRARAGAGAIARLDYAQLTAILSAAQASSRTAQLESRLAQGIPPLHEPVEAMLVLLESGSGWVDAARALGGSFHPAATVRAPSTKMTGAFTLAG